MRGALDGLVVFGGERGARGAKLRNHRFARGGGRRFGNLLAPRCPPLDFLQLDAVPGRVGDDGVEAASGHYVSEFDLPVKEVFTAGDSIGLIANQVESRGSGSEAGVVFAVVEDGVGAAGVAADGFGERGVERFALGFFHAGTEPAEAGGQIEHLAQASANLVLQSIPAKGFADRDDCEVQVGVKRLRRLRRTPREGGQIGKEAEGDMVGPPRGEVVVRGVDGDAEQGVAGADAVVEVGQRERRREAVQPERDFGEFDGHGVFIDAVDAALEHHAADERLAIGRGKLVPERAALLDFGADRGVDVRVQEGAAAGFDLVELGLDGRDVGRFVVVAVASVVAAVELVLDRGGEPVDGGDQEVPGAHCGVEDFEAEQRGGGVVGFGGLGLEGGDALVEQRPEGLLDNQVDELLRGVVGAAVLAGVGRDDDFDLVSVVTLGDTFEKALVDAAELLDLEVAVGDVVAGLGVAERFDDRRELGVGEFGLGEQRAGIGGEEAAVVGRQAHFGVAVVEHFGERGEVVPEASEDG